jgi:hypothetical protein
MQTRKLAVRNEAQEITERQIIMFQQTCSIKVFVNK